MFRAIGRYLRAFGYLITGRIDAARQVLNKSPHVIRATYDAIVEDKKRNIDRYMDAIGAMVAQREKKVATAKGLGEEIERLTRLKEGAAAKARKVVEELKSSGVSAEDIKTNEDYLKCLTAFNDFSTSLEEKHERVKELEADMEELGESISGHKVQLVSLRREIDTLKEEAEATVADMITAQEEEKISRVLAGISEDKYAKDLQDLRELREQQKGRAKIAKELAGTDTKRQEEEFLEYASKVEAADEFDRLIGLAEEADEVGGDAPDGKTRLPEQ